MMAGAKTAKRAKYTSAGYHVRRENELYIARTQAGSAQDDLLDLNKRGYRSERPWREETPSPAFTGAAAQETAVPVRRTRTRRKGFFETVIYHARRDKKGVLICLALLFAMLMMVAAFGGYDLVMKAYKEAVKEGYKFGCYGDVMLLSLIHI